MLGYVKTSLKLPCPYHAHHFAAHILRRSWVNLIWSSFRSALLLSGICWSRLVEVPSGVSPFHWKWMKSAAILQWVASRIVWVLRKEERKILAGWCMLANCSTQVTAETHRPQRRGQKSDIHYQSRGARCVHLSVGQTTTGLRPQVTLLCFNFSTLVHFFTIITIIIKFNFVLMQCFGAVELCLCTKCMVIMLLFKWLSPFDQVTYLLLLFYWHLYRRRFLFDAS